MAVSKEEMITTPATKRQRSMLFFLTKEKDWFDIEMSMSEASEEIARLKKEQQNAKVNKLVMFQEIWNQAMKAGKEAGDGCIPTPMVVQAHSNILDDNSAVEKEYHVPEGVCGFAWVRFRPGHTSFCRWLKEHGLVGPSYYGGLDYWVSGYGQSYERKMAFAGAMAGKLCEYEKETGTTVYSGGRLD